MGQATKLPLAECPLCHASCDEKKDLNRFNRRHPAKCQERMAFTKQVAEGVRSVEIPAQASDDWASKYSRENLFPTSREKVALFSTTIDRTKTHRASRATFRSVQEDL